MPTDRTPPDTATGPAKNGPPVRVFGYPSPLQRKVASALHRHAAHELGKASAQNHTIALRTLAERIRHEPNDQPVLIDALRGLLNIRVAFDLTGKDGRRLQADTVYLSQVIIKDNAKLCQYRYPPAMHACFRRPELRAHLNQAVQQSFRFRYARALYEACAPYKDNSSGNLARQCRQDGDQLAPGVTGWKPLKWWRKALGVKPREYPQFKYFNRDVLKPAMCEVNTFSDLVLQVQYGRKHRHVEELLFVIRRSRQPALLAPEDGLIRQNTPRQNPAARGGTFDQNMQPGAEGWP